MSLSSLREFIDNPDYSAEGLSALMDYVEEHGDLECVFEFGIICASDGDRAVSNNPVFRAGYQVGLAQSSITIESEEV